jgi:hypothetical protein
MHPGKPHARIPSILAVAIEPECVLPLYHSGGNSGALVIGVNHVAGETAPRRWIGINQGCIHIAPAIGRS